MEHNQSSKLGPFISPQSRLSNLSKMSLDRHSWEMGQYHNDKKLSLIEAMSIQSESRNRKSDIFESLLQSQRKIKNDRPSSIINSGSNEEYQYNQYNQHSRNSDVAMTNQIEIDHECHCFEKCLEQQCQCFKTTHQMCIKGTCCTKCVQIKTQLLKNNVIPLSNEGFSPQITQINNQNLMSITVTDINNFHISDQNPVNITITVPDNNNIQINEQVPQMVGQAPQVIACNCKNTECIKSYCKCFQKGQFCSQSCGCQSCKNKQESEQRNLAIQAIKSNNQIIYCTCKKTKCNKKYCSCYASGLKCGKHCSCQNCVNCVKNYQMDIQVYDGEEEEDYRNAQMPQRMSFQPVVFQ